ncbi:hypothetical protein AAC387_Pa03g1511 [Persea americana]
MTWHARSPAKDGELNHPADGKAWKDFNLAHPGFAMEPRNDVMHIEKNVFDNVFSTVMGVPGKTKDNDKARLDMKDICKRPGLELYETPNGAITDRSCGEVGSNFRKWNKRCRNCFSVHPPMP